MLSGHLKDTDRAFTAPVWLPRSFLQRQSVTEKQVLSVKGTLANMSLELFGSNKRLVLVAEKISLKTIGVETIVGVRKTHTSAAHGVYLENATNICVVSAVQVEDLSCEELPGMGTLLLLKMLGLGGLVYVTDPIPRELKTASLLATVDIVGALASEVCPNGDFPVSFLMATHLDVLRLNREFGADVIGGESSFV